MSFFDDLFHGVECAAWKTNPIFWQAVLAIKGAQASGAITSVEACKAAVENGDSVFSDLEGMVSSCGNCACEFVFSSSDSTKFPDAINGFDATGIHVFVRGNDDNAAWHKWWIDGWSDWENLGGSISTGLGAATPEPGQPHIFAFNGKELVHSSYDHGWSGWEPLGAPHDGLSNDAPAVTCPVEGQLHVFMRGRENTAWHKWWNNGWSDWENLGGSISSGLGAATPEPGQPHIFAIRDGELIHSWYGQEWSGWEPLGAPPEGLSNDAPAATCPVPGQLHVFVRGSHGNAWHKWWDNGWSGWENRGGGSSFGLGAATLVMGQPHIFGVREGLLIHSWWNGQSWSEWEDLGELAVGLGSKPGVTAA